MSGLAALQLILQNCPDRSIIMLSVSEEVEGLTTALQAGAKGCLIKHIDADYVMRAIRRAANGESLPAESMAPKLLRHLQGGDAVTAG